MTPNPQPQTLSLARALALPYFLHKRQESRMDPLSPSRAISNEPRRCRRLNVSPCSNGNGNGNGGTLQLSSSAPTRTMAAPATTRLLTNNFALSPANPRAIRRRSTATATATATSGLTEVLSPLELPVLDTSSASMRRLARELTEGQRMRSRRSIVDTRYSEEHKQESLLGKDYDDDHEEGSGNGNHCDQVDSSEDLELLLPPLKLTKTQQQQQQPHDSTSSYGSFSKTEQDKKSNQQLSFVETMIQQISAVAVVALLNMMIAIPFGASYFPIGWKAADDDLSGPSDDETPEDLDGTFPLQGKQALGIRMFLFATLIGQLAFTFGSKFNNPVGCQMVENVPFLHALCHVAIQRQGYGMEALSTVFFLFGLSSVVVGWTFYLLGKYELGKIVYFFPNHVLVGCIGGIGVFILITAVEVTNNATFEFSEKGWASLLEDFHLLAIVLGFECTLRFLIWWTQDSQGRPKYPLLSPIYYCMITPLFYLGLWILGISLNRASELGYFFSETSSENIGLADPHLWDMFQITNLSNISWMAVVESTGTMIALAAFSLIHVPINIPAFAISTDVGTSLHPVFFYQLLHLH